MKSLWFCGVCAQVQFKMESAAIQWDGECFMCRGALAEDAFFPDVPFPRNVRDPTGFRHGTPMSAVQFARCNHLGHWFCVKKLLFNPSALCPACRGPISLNQLNIYPKGSETQPNEIIQVRVRSTIPPVENEHSPVQQDARMARQQILLGNSTADNQPPVQQDARMSRQQILLGNLTVSDQPPVPQDARRARQLILLGNCRN